MTKYTYYLFRFVRDIDDTVFYYDSNDPEHNEKMFGLKTPYIGLDMVIDHFASLGCRVASLTHPAPLETLVLFEQPDPDNDNE